MKKLLAIIVLGLLLNTNAYTKKIEVYSNSELVYLHLTPKRNFKENLLKDQNYLKIQDKAASFCKSSGKKYFYHFASDIIDYRKDDLFGFVKDVTNNKSILRPHKKFIRFICADNLEEIQQNIYFDGYKGNFNKTLSVYTPIKKALIVGKHFRSHTFHQGEIFTNQGYNGYKLDLLKKDNIGLKNIFEKHHINFDMKSLKVDQVISPKLINNKFSKDIRRIYEIINVNNEYILMQEIMKNFESYCKDIKKSPKNIKNLKVFKNTTLIEECETQLTNYYNFKEDHNLNASTPFIFLNLNLNNGEVKRTYWPLEIKKHRKMYGKSFSKSVIKYDQISVDGGQVFEIILMAATVYLIKNKIDDFKNVGGDSKNIIKVKPNKTTPSSSLAPDSFVNRSIQQKYKILKYYGRIK